MGGSTADPTAGRCASWMKSSECRLSEVREFLAAPIKQILHSYNDPFRGRNLLYLARWASTKRSTVCMSCNGLDSSFMDASQPLGGSFHKKLNFKPRLRDPNAQWDWSIYLQNYSQNYPNVGNVGI